MIKNHEKNNKANKQTKRWKYKAFFIKYNEREKIFERVFYFVCTWLFYSAFY